MNFKLVMTSLQNLYRAQIWGARSSCINLTTGSETRAVVTPIRAMHPSDNAGCPIIDWLYSTSLVMKRRAIFVPF